MNQQLHRLFHRLWTKAVGTPTYNKQEWRELEAYLNQLSRPASLAGTALFMGPSPESRAQQVAAIEARLKALLDAATPSSGERVREIEVAGGG